MISYPAPRRSAFARLLLAAFVLSFAFAPIATAGAGATANESEPATAAAAKPAAAKPEETKETLVQDRIQVIGSRENVQNVPGSAHYIDKEELEKQDYADIHRILRQVPGVNIQEEDGLGLRPNIGMRGTGVERSAKITLMEDGVLIAPAPYTAPAAYYFPTAARLESVEVLKGPSAITQGPFTNGGALNLISSSIPNDFTARLDATGGSHGTQKFRAVAGDSGDRFGWVVDGMNLNSDGFKSLDNGGETGTEIKDYMGKLRFSSAPDAAVYQSLELKLGKTEQLGNETYLGLTDADFAATPYRRYAATSGDVIDTDHEQVQLRYFIKPTRNLDITTTVYNNDFARNWQKVDRVGGLNPADILEHPEAYPEHLAILRGELNSAAAINVNGRGAITLRNNDREYYSRGIQTVANYVIGNDRAQHEIELGLRYHEDQESRQHFDETWFMVNGAMNFSSEGLPGSQTNRKSWAEATSVYMTDKIDLGRWSISPGVRLEQIDYVREDYSTNDPTRAEGPTRVRENDVEVVLPGLGVDYRLNNENRVFAGVYRGFSPPGAGANENTKEEKSTNFELGYRHAGKALNVELIGFHNDYQNLLGTETQSSGGGAAGDLFNGGEVVIDGLEASLSYDFAHNRDLGVALPFSVNYTYTTTEFQTSFETSFADWSPAVVEGDELPYLPENQYTVSFGATASNWGLYLSLNHADEVRTKAGQGPIVADQSADAHDVLDLSGNWTIFKHYKLFAQVRNLTDEVYIVARRPYGVRPGLDRTFLFGASARF